MTILSCIDENDQNRLLRYLISMLDGWSYNIGKNQMAFDTAEELFHYFILDILTSMSYEFFQNKQLLSRVLENMRNIVADMEANLNNL